MRLQEKAKKASVKVGLVDMPVEDQGQALQLTQTVSKLKTKRARGVAQHCLGSTLSTTKT